MIIVLDDSASMLTRWLISAYDFCEHDCTGLNELHRGADLALSQPLRESLNFNESLRVGELLARDLESVPPSSAPYQKGMG
jgi:hypothetical protein